MGENVRPRISKVIYELVKMAASASCISTGHWIIEAIKEKATREGFQIVDGKIVYLEPSPNRSNDGSKDGFRVSQSQNIITTLEEM
jgi:hypothetical protein